MAINFASATAPKKEAVAQKMSDARKIDLHKKDATTICEIVSNTAEMWVLQTIKSNGRQS